MVKFTKSAGAMDAAKKIQHVEKGCLDCEYHATLDAKWALYRSAATSLKSHKVFILETLSKGHIELHCA